MSEQVIKFLQGQKVYLRPYQLEEAAMVYRATFEPEVRKLTGTQVIFTFEQVQQFFQKSQGDSSRVDMVIVTQEGDVPVGEVVLNDINYNNRSANIRILIFAPENFSKGYGSEAMRLMLDYGFGQLNLHRVSLGVYNFNPRAIHVYEKLGFKREGVLRDALFHNHQYVDEIMMSILEDEFRALYLPTQQTND